MAQRQSLPMRHLVWVALFANLVFAILKMVAGYVGRSHALVADGVESLSDSFSSILTLAALTFAHKPADEEHPFGHGRVEQATALLAAVILMGAGALIAMSSVNALIANDQQTPNPFTLVIIAFVILVKETLARRLLHAGRQKDNSLLTAEALHHRSDAFTSLAAFIGILLAVVGGPQFAMADPIAALLVTPFIWYNALKIGRTAFDEIMDRSPGPEWLDLIRESASQVPGVRMIDKCRARKSGDRWLLEIHVMVDGNQSVTSGHEIGHAVQRHLIENMTFGLREVVVHLEPANATSASRISEYHPLA